jgi:hypothetical protein
MSNGVEAKPHLRKDQQGWWRVSKVPVKWARLSTESRQRFQQAHKFATRENSKRAL